MRSTRDAAASMTRLSRLRTVVSLLALALSVLAGMALHAAGGEETVSGHLDLLAKGKKGPARDADVHQAVVYWEPANSPKKGLIPPEKPFEMVSKDKEFVPHVLVVPRGSRVSFPNQDVILHNVFSVSPGNSFDLGFYGKGGAKDKKFDETGLVRVFCNVHRAMVAYILVLDTPYHVGVAADGSFTLSGLPKGPGQLTIWHEQAEPFKVSLTLPVTAPVAAHLEVVRPQVPSHPTKDDSY
jgi:plastocyanin